MEISVKFLNGSKFNIDVEPSDTIAEVKRKIQQLNGCTSSFPIAHQLLIFENKKLENDKTLVYYAISENAIIYSMLNI